MKASLFGITAVTYFLVSTLSAALKPGDAAPKIQVSSWAQGDAVTAYEGDKVYIIEFWATWCGPCIASIPHIDALYKNHKDDGLVVIGQNLGEDAATVSKFLKSMAGKISYRVTVDDNTDGGWMAKHWLKAAEKNGIPCAFIVNKQGKIAYIGHPMQIKESMITSLLAEPSTKPAGQAPVAAAAPSAKVIELSTRAQTQIREGKLDDAESTIAQLHEALPANLSHLGGLMELELLLARNQPSDAIELSKLLCEDYSKNPPVVATVASHLVSHAAPSPQLIAAAEKIATPLSTRASEAQSSALATLARIAFIKGDKTRAVELQEKSVALATQQAEAAAKTALEAYQQDRLP
jgi:thiol-disulfide isomerase/thioredoxin